MRSSYIMNIYLFIFKQDRLGNILIINRQYQMSTMLTLESVLQNYELLGSNDAQIRHQANNFLFTIVDQPQAWIIASKIITDIENPHFRYLGAQILYQKIERELISYLHKNELNGQLNELRQFLIKQININSMHSLVDKLASSLGLILSVIVYKTKTQTINLVTWGDFIDFILGFMKAKDQNIWKGVLILQRIAEQLRNTNKMSSREKDIVKTQFLGKENVLFKVWEEIFNVVNTITSTTPSLLIANLNSIQSWIKIGFSLLKYPNLTKMVLMASLSSFDNLEACSRVICETLKTTSQTKFQVLSEVDPKKLRDVYNQEEIQSIRYILEFVIKHSSDFLPNTNIKSNKIDAQYVQMYINIVKDILLGFSFLLLQDIGFQLLMILLNALKGNDLKLSFATFQFWMDFSCKINRIKNIKEGGNDEIRMMSEKVRLVFVKVYQCTLQKTLIESQGLLQQADLKEQDTVDDNGSISFYEYRKQASFLLKCLYEYFREQGNGVEQYFSNLVNLIINKEKVGWRGVQLALYGIKSSIQSMIDETSTSYISKSIAMVVELINNSNGGAPVRVISETMNLIRDSTREVKTDKSVFVESLKFVLKYIEDDRLCNYAAYCFKVLIENVGVVDDESLVLGLLTYYSNQKIKSKNSFEYWANTVVRDNHLVHEINCLAKNQNNKEIVSEKILQGIFNSIIKFHQQSKVRLFVNSLLSTIAAEFTSKQQAFNLLIAKNIQFRTPLTSIFYDSLLDIKTLLDSYEGAEPSFRKQCQEQFYNLCKSTLKVIHYILGYSLSDSNNPCPKYSLMNELGLSVSTYKVILKISSNFTNEGKNLNLMSQIMESGFLIIMSDCLCVMNQKFIKQLCVLLSIISQTLLQFVGDNFQSLNEWLIQHIPQINKFFLTYYAFYADQINPTLNNLDPDIVKYYFSILEHLLLNNVRLAVLLIKQLQILRFALYSLRWANEKTMQRRVTTFLNLYVNQIINPDNQIINSDNLSQLIEQIVQNVFMSIPHINSLCYTSLGKILTSLLSHFPLENLSTIFSKLLVNLLFNYGKVNKTNVVLSLNQQNNVKMISSVISFAIISKVERYIKSALINISQIINNYRFSQNDQKGFIKHDMMMQLEMQLVNWKREIKKNNM